MRYFYTTNVLIKFLQIIMNRVKEFSTLSIFDHKIVEKKFITYKKIIILRTIPDCNYVHSEISLNNNNVKIRIVQLLCNSDSKFAIRA